MSNSISRREMLAATAAVVASQPTRAATETGNRVEGLPVAAKVGAGAFTNGGNAIDAVITAAFAATVVAPQLCGVGGYGGHFIAAIHGGKKIVAIDFNSTAPATMTDDFFSDKLAAQQRGWLSAGVPGTLAGLQAAVKNFGNFDLKSAIAPAAAIAKDGIAVDAMLATAILSSKANLTKDPATAKLFLPMGEPLKAGQTLRNPDLANMLAAFVKADSVDDFYRGDAAKQIANSFRANDGLVMEHDLKNYRAIQSKPAEWSHGTHTIFTPPPTSGGVTVLQTLALLDGLGWGAWPSDSAKSIRGRVEALRLAWHDRLRTLGDPATADVAWWELLDKDRIAGQVKIIEAALRDGKPVPATTDGRKATGTVHLSASDASGNYAAITLTHGGYFGAQVTVPGFGVTLGHGMSRFEPKPGHPNSAGPGKRPLHNMCPTIVMERGQAMLALGGRGGRKIPNAVFEVLAQVILRGTTPAAAVAAPRMHTEGGMTVELEKTWPVAARKSLVDVGYTIAESAHAVVSAVWNDGGAMR